MWHSRCQRSLLKFSFNLCVLNVNGPGLVLRRICGRHRRLRALSLRSRLLCLAEQWWGLLLEDGGAELLGLVTWWSANEDFPVWKTGKDASNWSRWVFLSSARVHAYPARIACQTKHYDAKHCKRPSPFFSFVYQRWPYPFSKLGWGGFSATRGKYKLGDQGCGFWERWEGWLPDLCVGIGNPTACCKQQRQTLSATTWCEQQLMIEFLSQVQGRLAAC